MNATLTKEQEDFLILMGKPNDGSPEYFLGDGGRILAKLVGMGLAYGYKGMDGKDTHDLTDEGEALYQHLTRKTPKPLVIEFTGMHRILSSYDSIAFAARVNDRPVECRISYEALMTRFHSPRSDKEFEQTFLTHRAEIEGIARKMIEAGRIGRDRIVRIMANYRV